jgi:phosphomannomutase
MAPNAATSEDLEAITFGTDGWRATMETFTAPRVRIVGQAVATYLRGEGARGPLVVGYDTRETSRGFAEELSRVLCANGFDVLVPERDVPTPVVAWTVRDRDLGGALMVTASHNPPEYNGVKFVPGGGAPALPEVTDTVEGHLAAPSARPESEWGEVTETDLRGPYLEHALEAVDANLSGLSVVYDAMHGAAAASRTRSSSAPARRSRACAVTPTPPSAAPRPSPPPTS